jgi:hypothetical protein
MARVELLVKYHGILVKDRQNPEKLPMAGSRRCKARILPGELDKGTEAQGARCARGT